MSSEQAPIYKWIELREWIGEGIDGGAATLWLMRHGQTEYNRDGLAAGQLDVELTPDGLAQAESAGEFLQGVAINAAWCSPLKRSRETCGLALEKSGHSQIVPTIEPRIIERFLGDAQGKPEVRHPDNAAGRMEASPPNGETYLHVTQRALSFLYDVFCLAQSDVSQPLQGLISSHNGTLRIISAILEDFDDPVAVLSRNFANGAPQKRELTTLHWPAFLAKYEGSEFLAD